MNTSTIDIVIPLGSGSKFDNFELRMALRSIVRYARNVGKVFVVTDHLPAWCRGVQHLIASDRHSNNKDANLIEKLLTACRCPELTERFLFWSDDQLALRDFDAANLVPVYNCRNVSNFEKNSIWHARMRNTFQMLKTRGISIDWNWDSHVPQPMEKEDFLKLVAPTDFARAPGYCINTLYFGLKKVKPFLEQSSVKATFENASVISRLPEGKLFLGYNDAGLQAGLLWLLKERFSHPCCFER